MSRVAGFEQLPSRVLDLLVGYGYWAGVVLELKADAGAKIRSGCAYVACSSSSCAVSSSCLSLRVAATRHLGQAGSTSIASPT